MKTRMIIAALIATVIALPATTSARMAKNGRPDMRAKWEALELTEKQQEQIRELHTANRSKRSESMKEMAELREKIKQEMLKENPNRDVLNGYAEKSGELHKAKVLERIDHLFELKTILTDEQIRKLVEQEDGKRRRMQHRGGGGPQEE